MLKIFINILPHLIVFGAFYVGYIVGKYAKSDKPIVINLSKFI